MVGDTEYYLTYGKFTWFKTASVSDVFDVQMKGKNRIRWEALDVDLSLSIITNPNDYPLIAKWWYFYSCLPICPKNAQTK